MHVTHVRITNAYTILEGNLVVKDHLGNVHIYVTLGKYSADMWAGFSWLREGKGGGLLCI
jgi:hypothetical protein